MMNFICIKWGDKYSPEYVNNLKNMVEKNFTRPCTFTCFTDDPAGLECEYLPIPDVQPLHPKYWFGKDNYCWDRAKFFVFNAHNILGYKGKYCYFDLDVIIQNNINDLEILAKKPRLVHSKWQPDGQQHDRFFIDIRGTYYNTSMMCWEYNQCEQIYYDVLEHQDVVFKTFFKGSDNYHYWRQRNFWGNIPFDWVYSYNRGAHWKEDNDKYKYRKEYKVCIFNTDLTPDPAAKDQIKISDLQDEKLLRHWHGANFNSKST